MGLLGKQQQQLVQVQVGVEVVAAEHLLLLAVGLMVQCYLVQGREQQQEQQQRYVQLQGHC
jgi:hypothetical protein